MSSNDTNTSIVEVLWHRSIEEGRTQDTSKDLNTVHVGVIKRINRLGDRGQLDPVGRLGHATEHGLCLPGARSDLVSEMVLAIDYEGAVVLVDGG